MKKIVGIMGAAAMLASSVFAVDFSARVYMTGNIADGKIDTTPNTIQKDKDGKIVDEYVKYKDPTKAQNDSTVNFLKLNKQDQKDDDALILSANMGNAGAKFQFWYNYDASGSAALTVRNTSLWFKPVDAVKVTVGDVSVNMDMNETLHYWKDPVGASYADWKSWAGKYGAFSTVEGAGFNLDVTPIDGLLITAGVVPGAGNPFMSFGATNANLFKINDELSYETTSQDFSTAKWGIGARYDLSKIKGLEKVPVTAAVSWRDEGVNIKTTKYTDAGVEKVGYANEIKPKILAIGAKYGARYGAGFYGLVNARLRFEQDSRTDKKVTGLALNGLTLDNHFKYAAGKFEAHLRAPVTFRFAKVYEIDETTKKEVVKKDVNGKEVYEASYLCWSAKVSYNMGGFTPYALFGSDLDNDGAWKFSAESKEGFLDTMNFEIQPGLTFNVGSCAFDIGLRLNLNAGTFSAGQNMYWSKDKNGKVQENVDALYDKGATAYEKIAKTGADITWSIPVTMSVKF